MSTIEKRVFKVIVADKYIRREGLFFKHTNYFLVFKLKDGDSVLTPRKVGINQYYKFNVGDIADLTLYKSLNYKNWWCYSPEEATWK